MQRRDFFTKMGLVGAGTAAFTMAPGRELHLISSTGKKGETPTPRADLVRHARRILEQNLLERGETFVVATPRGGYDQEYVAALLTAAGNIGANGMHVAVVAQPTENGELESALTPLHWDVYRAADFLITSSFGAPEDLPGPATAYGAKVGDHEYRTDFESVSCTDCSTRWLQMGPFFSVPKQKEYFPTQERKQLTVEGARLLDQTRGTLRVTSAAGSDWSCSMEGRPGHAQYGIADVPGKWDNFGYGCVACGPVEDSAEGVLVLEPGDIVKDRWPHVLDEEIRLTFEGGYVTEIEGGKRARGFQQLLDSYDDPEAYGTSHFGWGTHKKTHLKTGSEDEIGHYHHNKAGSLLFALGMNFGHGLGGEQMGYSGLGQTQRRAPNHTHFAMFNANCFVEGQQVVEEGELLMG